MTNSIEDTMDMLYRRYNGAIPREDLRDAALSVVDGLDASNSGARHG